MNVSRMCDLGHVSRTRLYRVHPAAERTDDDLDVRDDIQKIALEFPYYGRPRITAELKRRDWEVTHKRVVRIMREVTSSRLRRFQHGSTFLLFPVNGNPYRTERRQLWWKRRVLCHRNGS